MKKITTVLALFVLALFATSCQNEPSLQQYLVESQEKNGFITVDIPVNFIKPKSMDVSEDIKKAINSIRKVNLVALPYQGNEETYQAEKDKLNTILKNEKKYKSLMRMNREGMKISMYYTGESDAIDEVIAFGYGKEVGVGIARILGEDIDPSMMIEVMKNMDFDSGAMNLKNLNLAF